MAEYDPDQPFITYARDEKITPFGLATLKDRYFQPGETSPQHCFARAAFAYASNPEHAQRIYNYASKLYFMFSTPILSNGGTEKGLGISCFLSHVPDSRQGILDHYTEVAWLSSIGGGTSGAWSDVRSNGAKMSTGGQSTGIIPFMHVVDAEMLAWSQRGTRRGSYAAYLDISHPEILEFIQMRKPTGGDENRKNLNLHHGVNIPDKFMENVKNGLNWDLIDPNSGDIVSTVSARDLWQQLLELRVATGEPYFHFIDRSNECLPKSQKDKGLKVNQSNLCSEVTLPTNEQRSAVCCLSSVNLEYYDEWKSDPYFIPDIIEFLDNVISDFIKKAPEALHKAVCSASQERSLGLGAMGFHAYLQKKNIPFAGPLSVGINKAMFKHIKGQAAETTKRLAVERGACPDSDGTVRNMHLMAIAPNASSSIICGTTSPSIEPYRANAFTQKTMSGSFLVKNPHLENVLKECMKNTDEVWTSIITNKGSVQHLDFLDDWQKSVFKTAIELDQHWIIQHAANRQEYICQSQSVNLFFPADVDVSYLHNVHFSAWEKGLKSLYYLRSETVKRAETIDTKVERIVREESDCLGCEG